MKLWLISQHKHNGYDTYRSAVVVAETKEEAMAMHPDGAGLIFNEVYRYNYSWVHSPECVDCKCLGLADAELEAGVICANFNAG